MAFVGLVNGPLRLYILVDQVVALFVFLGQIFCFIKKRVFFLCMTGKIIYTRLQTRKSRVEFLFLASLLKWYFFFFF